MQLELKLYTGILLGYRALVDYGQQSSPSEGPRLWKIQNILHGARFASKCHATEA